MIAWRSSCGHVRSEEFRQLHDQVTHASCGCLHQDSLPRNNSRHLNQGLPSRQTSNGQTSRSCGIQTGGTQRHGCIANHDVRGVTAQTRSHPQRAEHVVAHLPRRHLSPYRQYLTGKVAAQHHREVFAKGGRVIATAHLEVHGVNADSINAHQNFVRAETWHRALMQNKQISIAPRGDFDSGHHVRNRSHG